MPTNTFRPLGGNLKRPHQRPVMVLAPISPDRAAELVREAREKEERRKRWITTDEAVLDLVQ